jgi:photosystem II oxygen-evolving enhancer protein 2
MGWVINGQQALRLSIEERTKNMLRRMLAILLLVIMFNLGSMSSAWAVAGLKVYEDVPDGYKFLYPNGWVEVKVSKGPDVVFRDLIEMTENISVVINPVATESALDDLGTASEVGYRLSKAAIAPPDSGRQAELVNAEAQKIDGHTYYLLEYAVKLPNNQLRHNLAMAVVNRSKLYTFNASAKEQRWKKMKPLMEKVVQSFRVY